MSKKTKKTLIIVVVSVLVFVVGGAVAYAATNISELEELYLAFRTAQTQQAVENDVMTQEQADEYLAKLTERMGEDEKDAVPPINGGNGMLHGGNAVALYAQVSGLSEDDITAQLEEDEISVFAMADEAGKLDDLKSALLADANEKIDKLLENDKIDADKATEMKEKAEERIGSITADTQMRGRQGKSADGSGGLGGMGRRGDTGEKSTCDGESEA